MAEKKDQTLIKQVGSTILSRIIQNNLWLKILLAITQVSNLLFTFLLDWFSPYKISTELLLQLNYLQVLGSPIYVFIHEKNRKAKSAKWESWIKYWLLASYDNHFIYQVYLEKDEKIIQIKELRIFENASIKLKTSLPIYDTVIWKPIFIFSAIIR